VWALPPKPQKRVVHTYIGASNGKSSEAVHLTKESTPLSVLLLFFAEIITLLVLDTNRYYDQFLQNFNDGTSPQREVTEAVIFAFLSLTLQMIFKAGFGTSGRKWSSFVVHSTDKRWHVPGTNTYYAFCISRIIIEMELTEMMIDCGNYLTYYKS